MGLIFINVKYLLVYIYDMRIKLICDWNDRKLGETLDLPDILGAELLRRNIAIEFDEMGLNFVLVTMDKEENRWMPSRENNS